MQASWSRALLWTGSMDLTVSAPAGPSALNSEGNSSPQLGPVLRRDSERIRATVGAAPAPSPSSRPAIWELSSSQQLDDTRSSCVCVQLPLAVLGANKS